MKLITLFTEMQDDKLVRFYHGMVCAEWALIATISIGLVVLLAKIVAS